MRVPSASPTDHDRAEARRASRRIGAILRAVPLLALVLLGADAIFGGASAADAKAGRKAATACQTCHGLDGLSKLPEAPNLAGQVEPYLVKALTEYRDGVRSNEIMNVVAKPLSDAEIANLAAYYSAIQIDVLPPG